MPGLGKTLLLVSPTKIFTVILTPAQCMGGSGGHLGLPMKASSQQAAQHRRFSRGPRVETLDQQFSSFNSFVREDLLTSHSARARG